MFGLLLNTMKKGGMLPKISDTERLALESGDVWVDGELFRGNPDWKKMMAEGYSRLTEEEQAFLDGPTEELCRMADPWMISKTGQVPDEIFQFIKDKGFMGMIIDKKWGGLGFSPSARAAVMGKISPYCPGVGTMVVIPNSLGAAELLQHYGTAEQQQQYLPKLATGEFVPCFGLTEPTAGSDAASIKADGEVFKDDDGETKIRMNFRKRFITMAPIANLISVATVLRDPNNLLGKGEDVGITVVLVEKGTPGLTNGDRHWPIGDPFYNGPIIGKDVVVPVSDIVGGIEYAGQGWRMLMEQLAGGRAVSLPAGGVGGTKSAAAVTGAFSMVRQQFGMPIGHMEGVEVPIARIAGMAYLTDAAHKYTLNALDKGIAPPVLSAILKQQTTEIAQQCAVDGMDVFSGSGVMQGPNNVPGVGYRAAPVSITVEGANIMTRTLMIFGQGATRCHPYAQNVLAAVDAEDVPAFRNNLLAWLGHVGMTFARVVVRGFTRGYSAGSPVSGPTATYFRRLSWSSARFALLTNMAMMLMGSKLKARGRLTGRYADVLSWMYMGFATLQRWEVEGRQEADLPVVRFAMDTAMAKIQEGFEGIYANFDAPIIGLWLRTVGRLMLRMNPIGTGPTDQQYQDAARSIQSLSPTYHRITNGVAQVPEDKPGAGRLRKAFRLVCEAQPALNKVTTAQKARKLPRGHAEEVAAAAAEAGIITAEELTLINEQREARLAAIEVDVFPFDINAGLLGSSDKVAEAA